MNLCKDCKYGYRFTVTLNRSNISTHDCAVGSLSAPQTNSIGEVCECNCYTQFTMPADDEIGEALDNWLKTIYDSKSDKSTVAPAMQHLKDVSTKWVYDTWEKCTNYSDETYKKVHCYMCSKCRGRSAAPTKYCPNCGAKMEGISKW